MNLSNLRMFSFPSYRVVYRSLPNKPEWTPVTNEGSFEQNFANMFKYTWLFEAEATEQIVYFAFAVPYPYYEIIRSIDCYQAACPTDTYFYRETLTLSVDRRPVELVTISAVENFERIPEERLANLFPGGQPRCLRSTVPVIFLSARVHPGETPASYTLDGMLRALLADDCRAKVLRQAFVFKIIPVLNPDGVYRGHYRVDQYGINLNRCYIDPSPSEHPTIYAAKSYVQYLHNTYGNLLMYLDLHAHPSKRGAFVFGNALTDQNLIETKLYAKLLSLNSGLFDFMDCDFSERSMVAKDPKDCFSKEGCGRVAIYKMTGVVHCYTVEAFYYSVKTPQVIPQLMNVKSGRRYNTSFMPILGVSGIPVYNRDQFDDIGNAVAYSILDVQQLNPLSRVPASEQGNLDGMREWIRNRIFSTRNRLFPKQNNSKQDLKLRSKSSVNDRKDKAMAQRKLALRKPHPINVVAPVFYNRPSATMNQQNKRRNVRNKTIERGRQSRVHRENICNQQF